jgi:hypothetical protein
LPPLAPRGGSAGKPVGGKKRAVLPPFFFGASFFFDEFFFFGEFFPGLSP